MVLWLVIVSQIASLVRSICSIPYMSVFPLTFFVDLCLLNNLTWIISSVADFPFPLFPTVHGLPAVILVCNRNKGSLIQPMHAYFSIFSS